MGSLQPIEIPARPAEDAFRVPGQPAGNRAVKPEGACLLGPPGRRPWARTGERFDVSPGHPAMGADGPTRQRATLAQVDDMLAGARQESGRLAGREQLTVAFHAAIVAVFAKNATAPRAGSYDDIPPSCRPTSRTSSTSASASACPDRGLTKQGRIANRPSTRVEEVMQRPRARTP